MERNLQLDHVRSKEKQVPRLLEREELEEYTNHMRSITEKIHFMDLCEVLEHSVL